MDPTDFYGNRPLSRHNTPNVPPFTNAYQYQPPCPTRPNMYPNIQHFSPTDTTPPYQSNFPPNSYGDFHYQQQFLANNFFSVSHQPPSATEQNNDPRYQHHSANGSNSAKVYAYDSLSAETSNENLRSQQQQISSSAASQTSRYQTFPVPESSADLNSQQELHYQLQQQLQQKEHLQQLQKEQLLQLTSSTDTQSTLTLSPSCHSLIKT
ncbi:uncharacterized protein [Epargyreus clarus]|uniref:uncharacterized protein n=1 Tax=Epargyreus clarus TaxID=520877 RepID=UPI003C2B9FB9